MERSSNQENELVLLVPPATGRWRGLWEVFNWDLSAVGHSLNPNVVITNRTIVSSIVTVQYLSFSASDGTFSSGGKSAIWKLFLAHVSLVIRWLWTRRVCTFFKCEQK